MSIPAELQVFILSMSPVGELRGAIPLGIGFFNMSWQKAFVISFVGNTLAVIVVLLCLDKVSRYLSSHSRVLARFLEWLFARTRRKYEKRFMLWKELALIAFVAIPLPGTGGWTGALCAYLFGIPYKKAIPILSVGIFIAGIITTLCTVGIIKIAF